MLINEKKPPREFEVGLSTKTSIKDCGTIMLDSDEQITFVTGDEKEYDVTRKNWGYYATSSVNGRLKDQGFKTALVKNSFEKYYVMIIEKEKIKEFETYLKQEKNYLVQWLDEL